MRSGLKSVWNLSALSQINGEQNNKICVKSAIEFAAIEYW